MAQRVRFWRWRRYRRPSREHLGSGEVIENWNIPSANARYIQPDHCGGSSPRVVVSAMIVVISGVVAARAVTRALHSSIAKSSMLAPCPSDTAALHRTRQRASHTLKAETPRHATPSRRSCLPLEKQTQKPLSQWCWYRTQIG